MKLGILPEMLFPSIRLQFSRQKIHDLTQKQEIYWSSKNETYKSVIFVSLEKVEGNSPVMLFAEMKL
jgi:hypothetical protein